MPAPLFRSIPVEYTGLYSDEHLIDLQEFGASLQGLARLSNSAVDFYLHGRIKRDSRRYQVRLFAAPPTQGSVLLDIVALYATAQLPLYAPLLCDLATDFIVPLIKAIIATRLKRSDVSDAALAKVIELAQTHDEFARSVHEGHMRDKAWLQAHIDRLAAKNATPLKEMVSPIGKTCRQLQIGQTHTTTEEVIVGEAEAQVISSRKELSVGDTHEYRGVFEGVDTTNGSCKFRPDGSADEITGKITDPALLTPENVYTHSLDTKQAITISAKAVVKDGEIVRLFISDGRFT